jgi:hypothetical protein
MTQKSLPGGAPDPAEYRGYAGHAMMGEVGFVSLGIDWTEIPLNFTWSLGLNTKLTPLERHAVLFSIEQGLMPKTNGKEQESQIANDTGDCLTSLVQDYDGR